jgi:hypothetical protein
MIFADSNGMAFGMSGSSQITASYTQSTHSHATAAFSGSNGSFTADTVTFGNLNGLSFYTSNGSMVGSHNALTTARASTDAVGLGTAQTNVTWTVNSAGISLNASGYAGITTAVTGNAVITLNSLGMRFDGAGLAGTTTAITGRAAITMNSGGFQFNGSGLAGTGFTSTTTAGTAIVATNSTNGLSLAFPTIVTNALTTARASTDAVGLNTAQTNVTWTVNSSGLSFNAAGYAGTTTAITGGAAITMNSAGFQFNGTGLAGTGTTFAGANISGSITQNTAGLNLSLSVAAPGAAAEANAHNLLGANTAGNTTATGSTIGLSGIGVTLSGTNASQIVISGGVNFSGGTTNQTLSAITFSNSNGVSFGMNGSTMTASVLGRTDSYYGNFEGEWPNSTTMQMLQSTSHIQHFILQDPLSFGFIRIPMSASFAASTTAATTGNTQFSYGQTRSHNFVIYSRGVGASSQSLQSVISTQFTDQQSMNISANANSTQFSYSVRATYQMSTGVVGFTHDYSSSAASLNYHTSQMTAITGLKMMEFPWATSLPAGLYWLMYGVSSSTTSQFTNVGTRWFNVMSNYGVSQPNLQFGTIGAATANSVGLYPGLGSFSTAGGGTTASLDLSAVTTSSAHNKMFFQMIRIA